MDLCGGKYCIDSDISVVENLANNDSSKSVVDSLKLVSKSLYDQLYRDNSLTELKPKSFRKLLIDGFDAEQIFQQIDLQNRSALVHFNTHISEIDDSKYTLSEDEAIVCSDSDNEDSLIQNYKQSEIPSQQGEYVFDDDSDVSETDMADLNPDSLKEGDSGADADSADDEEDDELLDVGEEGKINRFGSDEESDKVLKSSKSKKVRFQNDSQKKKYKSVVDDQFFKLSNLEEFLKIEDLRAENKLDDMEKDDDDEEDIDYYQDIPSDEDIEDSEDELKDPAEGKTSKTIMYDDFFDAPESGEEDEKVVEDELFDENVEDEEDEDDGNDNQPSQAAVEKKVSKTPFELEQDKVKNAISSYEDSLLQNPEWHLTGEVAANSRPKDSLLHQDTDFDVNAKSVIVEDDDLEQKTDKALLSIIKNKAFSEGQKTYKPVHDITLTKDIVVDQAKSKKSLAEVYEQDYLKKKYGEQQEENPKHVEIKKMMDDLLPELQALFAHIPKPAMPDIKIVSNLPSITVEDVAPTSVSDATLLAPEEVKKKSGMIKGHSERTDTDRKRERRKKKLFQKMKYLKMEKEAAENPNSAKAKKFQKMNALKKVKQHRNTKIAELGGEKIKSSKDFFARLQETVHSNAQQPPQKKRKK